MVTAASNSPSTSSSDLEACVRQVVAQLGHEADRLRVDLPRRLRAGAERLDAVAAVDARERLGHLAAVGVLDADEQDALHGWLGWLGWLVGSRRGHGMARSCLVMQMAEAGQIERNSALRRTAAGAASRAITA